LAKNTDHLAGGLDTDNTGGVLSGLLAEEDDLDRHALWRIGSWGVGAVAAVILAVMANQTSLGWKRDQVAAADLTRQAQQIQQAAKETHSEARRLGLRHRHAQQRPGPALYPRHHAGTGPGLGDRRDCAPELRQPRPWPSAEPQAAQNPAPGRGAGCDRTEPRATVSSVAKDPRVSLQA